MSGIDQAAAAFQQDMGGGKPTETAVAAESMFGRLGDLEVDEDSPPVGGGDHLRGPGELDEEDQPAPRRARKPVATEEDDPEADIYADEDDSEADDKVKEDEDDEDADEDADDAGELDMDAIVEVTVDGQKQEVSVREALDGYIRTETLHKRLNEIDEIRDVMDREAGTLMERQQKYISLIDEAGETLAALLPKEPDWDALFAKDPNKARQLQKDYEALRGQIGALRSRREQAVREFEETNSRQTAEFIVREKKKFDDSNPNWQGEEGTKKKEKDLASMVRTARSVGFTAKEIAETYDSRMLKILLKASKYDRMMAAKPKPVKKGAPPARGAGHGNSRTASRGIGRAQQQLARSGSVHDAAAVFENLLKPTPTPRRRR